jgi:outer membrane protein assembly factor BamB
MFDLFQKTGDTAWVDDGCTYLEACLRAGGEAETSNAPGSDPVFGKEIAGGVLVLTSAFRATHHEKWLDRSVRYAERMVDEPIPSPAMATQMAERIEAFLGLYEATADSLWMDHAAAEGGYAVSAFVHRSGLIKGTARIKRREYYDAIQGPGRLAFALQSLGESLALRSSGVMAQPWPIVMEEGQGPLVTEIAVSEFPLNHEPIKVTARITHPQGVLGATLRYALGYVVGLHDEHPRREGALFTFTIPPPFPFQGSLAFAVEALSEGANTRRTMRSWSTVQIVAADVMEANADGFAICTRTGTSIGDLAPGDHVRVETRPLASQTECGIPRPCKCISKVFCVDAPRRWIGTLRLRYTAAQVDRLMGSTLKLAMWDVEDSRWVVASDSHVDAATRTVSNTSARPGKWTIVGIDRVLWQAAQREANPTIADVDDDGRLEIALTQYVNGELLSANGESRFTVALRPSNRPVQNTSSPLVADVDGDGRPEVVFGATSGNVHAFRADGKELWKTMVGGEVRGGVASAELPKSSDRGISVAWHDAGIAVINGDGTLRWQRSMVAPADCTPVIAPRDNGDICVIGADGLGLVAFRCIDGEEIWRHPVAAGAPVAPAVGEIRRGGEIFIVTGDASGRISVLDTAGKLRTSWLVPATHTAYAPISEVGLADLLGVERRQIIVTTAGGLVWAYEADGIPVWQFKSREQETGYALGVGGRLAFTDLSGDGQLNVLVAEQDQYIYALAADGTLAWEFRGAFFYHYSPVVADLEGDGNLTLITTSPCPNGTYALRAGRTTRRSSNRLPWPTMRGNWQRTNCAPW